MKVAINFSSYIKIFENTAFGYVAEVPKFTSEWKTLEQVYFLRAVECLSSFDIQISITLAIFWEKLQNDTF